MRAWGFAKGHLADSSRREVWWELKKVITEKKEQRGGVRKKEQEHQIMILFYLFIAFFKHVSQRKSIYKSYKYIKYLKVPFICFVNQGPDCLRKRLMETFWMAFIPENKS